MLSDVVFIGAMRRVANLMGTIYQIPQHFKLDSRHGGSIPAHLQGRIRIEAHFLLVLVLESRLFVANHMAPRQEKQRRSEWDLAWNLATRARLLRNEMLNQLQPTPQTNAANSPPEEAGPSGSPSLQTDPDRTTRISVERLWKFYRLHFRHSVRCHTQPENFLLAPCAASWSCR